MSSVSELNILELRNVAFSYDKHRPFIKDLSFSVGEGEFIGLLGANGSGKSTILKLGSGILSPSRGEILLWSKTLKAYHNKDRAKLISYLPQTLDISVPFTIRELVSMGLYPYDIPPSMGVDSALEMVGLQGKASNHLADLSGGEKRRTLIAMTLVQGAGLLMLDEPLANLDIRYQVELVRLLKALRDEKNISIIMALHDINMALRFSKVILVKDGSILGIGTPEEVLSDAWLRDAFDIKVSIIRQPDGSSFIRYGDDA